MKTFAYVLLTLAICAVLGPLALGGIVVFAGAFFFDHFSLSDVAEHLLVMACCVLVEAFVVTVGLRAVTWAIAKSEDA